MTKTVLVLVGLGGTRWRNVQGLARCSWCKGCRLGRWDHSQEGKTWKKPADFEIRKAPSRAPQVLLLCSGVHSEEGAKLDHLVVSIMLR